jgi:hypothetical protein
LSAKKRRTFRRKRPALNVERRLTTLIFCAVGTFQHSLFVRRNQKTIKIKTLDSDGETEKPRNLFRFAEISLCVRNFFPGALYCKTFVTGKNAGKFWSYN